MEDEKLIQWDDAGTWADTVIGEYAIHDVDHVVYLDFGGVIKQAIKGETLGRYMGRNAARDAAEIHFRQQQMATPKFEQPRRRSINSGTGRAIAVAAAGLMMASMPPVPTRGVTTDERDYGYPLFDGPFDWNRPAPSHYRQYPKRAPTSKELAEDEKKRSARKRQRKARAQNRRK